MFSADVTRHMVFAEALETTVITHLDETSWSVFFLEE